jgi:hypothetical protein
MVSIEPGPEKASMWTSGADLVIRPESETAGRSFSIRILPGLRDVFGQELVEPQHVKVRVKPAPPRPALQLATHGRMVVIDPRGPAKIVVLSRDLPEFRIKVFKISRRDWARHYLFLGKRYGEIADLSGESQDKIPPEFGAPVMDRVIRVKGGGQGKGYTEVDCSDVLDPFGHAWVCTENRQAGGAGRGAICRWRIARIHRAGWSIGTSRRR